MERERSKSMTFKDWLSIVVMPTLIALAVAILAVKLQDRSFLGNQLFTLKMNQINMGREAAVDALRDVDRATRQIRADEKWIRDQIANPTAGLQHDMQSYQNGDYFVASIDALKDSKVRVDALVASSEATGSGEAVAKAADKYTVALGALVTCLQNNHEFRCVEKGSDVLPFLREIVVAHTTAANDLIRQSQ